MNVDVDATAAPPVTDESGVSRRIAVRYFDPAGFILGLGFIVAPRSAYVLFIALCLIFASLNRRRIVAGYFVPAAFILSLGFIVVPLAACVLFVAALCLIFATSTPGRIELQDVVGPIIHPRSLAFPFALLILYLVVKAAWSPIPGRAYESALLFAAFGLFASLAIGGIANEEPAILSRFGWGFAKGLLAGAALVAVEGLTDQLLTRTAMSLIPVLRPPDGGHATIDNGLVTYINRYVLKRNCTALLLLLWPVLLIFFGKIAKPRVRPLACFTIFVSAVAVVAVGHDSGLLALVVSTAVFVLASLYPKATRRLCVVAWLAINFLIVPAAHEAYEFGFYKEGYGLNFSGRARIIIWGFTAQQVAAAPIFGSGIAAAEYDKTQLSRPIPAPTDHIHPLTTDAHAHNVFLQTWYELGFLGDALLLVLGLGLLQWIGKLEPSVGRFALAGFGTTCIFAALSFGMWQEWYQALIFTEVVMMRLAIGCRGALPKASSASMSLSRPGGNSHGYLPTTAAILVGYLPDAARSGAALRFSTKSRETEP